jgi:hypothetical protein
MYPPLAVLVINLQGGGKVAATLVFGIPLDRACCSRAFVKYRLKMSVLVRTGGSFSLGIGNQA